MASIRPCKCELCSGDQTAGIAGSKWSAAHDYWDAIRAGIVEALEAGHELLPDLHPEHKAAIIDVMEK